MDEEQPVGIVLSLDPSESSVVAPPVRVLPSVFEVVTLTYVRSRIRHECAKLTHALIDASRGFTARLDRRFMIENPGVSWPLAVRNNGKSKRA
jgi:hypothetical protein